MCLMSQHDCHAAQCVCLHPCKGTRSIRRPWKEGGRQAVVVTRTASGVSNSPGQRRGCEVIGQGGADSKLESSLGHNLGKHGDGHILPLSHLSAMLISVIILRGGGHGNSKQTLSAKRQGLSAKHLQAPPTPPSWYLFFMQNEAWFCHCRVCRLLQASIMHVIPDTLGTANLNKELTYFFFDDPLGYPIDGSQFECKSV